jgi:CHC2 zinc finger
VPLSRNTKVPHYGNPPLSRKSRKYYGEQKEGVMGLRSILQERVNIVELVNMFGADLKPCGDYYIGYCLQNDCPGRSFAVYPERGKYECLECGIKGDILDFVSNVIGFSFGDAQNWLAEEFKIPLKDLQKIMIFVDPAIKKLSKRAPQQQLEDDIHKALIAIAKCHLNRDNELQCYKNLKKTTGTPLKQIRHMMQNVRKVLVEEYDDREEKQVRIDRYREYKRRKKEALLLRQQELLKCRSDESEGEYNNESRITGF